MGLNGSKTEYPDGELGRFRRKFPYDRELIEKLICYVVYLGPPNWSFGSRPRPTDLGEG